MKCNKRERLFSILSESIFSALLDGSRLDLADDTEEFDEGWGQGYFYHDMLILKIEYVRELVTKFCDGFGLKAPKLKRKILERYGFVNPNMKTLCRNDEYGMHYTSKAFALNLDLMAQQVQKNHWTSAKTKSN